MDKRWVSIGVAAMVAGAIVVYAVIRGTGSSRGSASEGQGRVAVVEGAGPDEGKPAAVNEEESSREQLRAILARLKPDERDAVEQYHETVEDKLYYARIYDVQRTFSGDDKEVEFIHDAVDAYKIMPPGSPEPESFEQINKVLVGTTALVYTWQYRGPMPGQAAFMKRAAVRLSEDRDETLRMAAGLTLKLLDENGVELSDQERRAYEKLMDQPAIADLVQTQWGFLHDPEWAP